MKGMTAIQVIVSLALGLIVIVGLGYLVWTWIGRGSGALTEQDCRARSYMFCTLWSRNGYTATESFIDEYPGCNSYAWAASLDDVGCKNLLGQE